MARIAFCQEMMVEYMGFMSMSACLKEAGHTVEVFIDAYPGSERLLRELAAFNPDVVGFSLLTPSVPWALELARNVKSKTRALTIFGGVHVIICPEIIEEDGIDAVCVGEGEPALTALCDALDRGTDHTHIEDLWIKGPEGVIKNPRRTALVDLDALPFHDRELYNKYAFFRHSHYLRILMGKGCPFRCAFCGNANFVAHFGKDYIRKQSPERALAEIEHTIARHPAKIKTVFFIDEVFWVRKEWLRSFLPLYKERIGLPFTALFRFGGGIDESDVKLMAEAGAATMAVANESGDECQRMQLLKKPVTDKEIQRVTGWMRKYGIHYDLIAFFGLPGDTVEDHVARLKFYRQLNPLYLWTTFFQPYPGLALTENERVREYLPKDKAFPMTLHHDMYLDLPDKGRIVRLKKVYFLCMKFSRLERPLVWLTKYRVPLLFDLLFLCHFAFYAIVTEKLSAVQFAIHVRTFAGRSLRTFFQKVRHSQCAPHVHGRNDG